jgi:hypothetical protein
MNPTALTLIEHVTPASVRIPRDEHRLTPAHNRSSSSWLIAAAVDFALLNRLLSLWVNFTTMA